MIDKHKTAFFESIDASGASPALIHCVKEGFALCEGVFAELDIELREAAEKLRAEHGPDFPVRTVLAKQYPGLAIPEDV